MERVGTVVVSIIAFALATTACGAGSGSPTEPDVPTDLPAEVADATKEALHARTGIPVGDIEVEEAEQREWPDACHGLAEEGEMCAEVITPGWQVTLRAHGDEHVFHTDARCAAIRMKE
ncbi:MAG: hypothetical protein PVJ55_07530 [Anaerolineae bacterium]|jgi:hypothetical protein